MNTHELFHKAVTGSGGLFLKVSLTA